MSENNELATQQPTTHQLADVGAAPAHLAKAEGEERLGTAMASKYQTINRISIVQSQSGKQRRDMFGLGAFAMLPDGVLVAEPDTPFIGIPLLFWPTWEKWSDYNDKASPTVIETSLDEFSDIAVRSKAPSTRQEPYGNGFNYSYIESLNILVMIDSGPAQGEVAVMSFAKSDHYAGKQIAKIIERSDTDIFARRIEFGTIDKTDGSNDWYGIALNNPSEEDGGVWIKPEQIEELKALHIEADKAHKANLIVINRDDEPETGGAGGSAGGSGDYGDLPPV